MPKSTTTKKKQPAKRAASKTTKKAPSRSAASSKKSAPVKSFRRCPESEPFFLFRASLQTAYWIVLGIIVVAFTAWIFKLQTDIQSIYDQIDESVVIERTMVPHKHR